MIGVVGPGAQFQAEAAAWWAVQAWLGRRGDDPDCDLCLQLPLARWC